MFKGHARIPMLLLTVAYDYVITFLSVSAEVVSFALLLLYAFAFPISLREGALDYLNEFGKVAAVFGAFTSEL